MSSPEADTALRASPAAVTWPVMAAVLQGYLLLLPAQFVVDLGGLILPAYRIFLLGAFFYIVAELMRGRLRRLPDAIIVFATMWIAIALVITMGPDRAFSGAGSQFIDIALSYLFARCAFRELRDLRVFLLLIAPGLFLAGGIVMAESLAEQYIIQPLASAITGRSQTIFATAANTRLGLLRGVGPFPHPILAGLFLSSFLSLYMLSGLKGWPRFAGVIAAVMGFFSVSSAALLSLTVTAVFLTCDWLTTKLANLSWRIFVLIGSIGIFVTEFATSSGAIGLIMRFASLNQVSAFYRRLIWRYGTESVAANPWIGIGFNEWARPHWMNGSVDNYWLLLAMQYGLMPPFLILLTVIIAIIGLAKAQQNHTTLDAMLVRGLAIAISVATLAAFSVSIWLSMQVWFFMLLGIAVSLRTAAPKNEPALHS